MHQNLTSFLNIEKEVFFRQLHLALKYSFLDLCCRLMQAKFADYLRTILLLCIVSSVTSCYGEYVLSYTNMLIPHLTFF